MYIKHLLSICVATVFTLVSIVSYSQTTNGTGVLIPIMSLLLSDVALTDGPDVITGGAGPDTFVTSEKTLGPGDVLDGAGGSNVLNYSSSGAGPIVHTGFALRNIQTVNITFNATGGTAFDMTGSTGITRINLKQSSSSITITGLDAIPTLGLESADGEMGLFTTEGIETLTIGDPAGASSRAASTTNTVASGMPTSARILLPGLPPELPVDGFMLSIYNTNNSSNNYTVINQHKYERQLRIIPSGQTGLFNSVDGSGELKAITVDSALSNVHLGEITNIPAEFTLDASKYSGNLSATFTSTATASSNIEVIGGSGSEKITFEGVGFNAGDKFDGGAGTDVMIVPAGDYYPSAKFTPLKSVKNTERLSFVGPADTQLDHYEWGHVNDVPTQTPFQIIQHNGPGDLEVRNAGPDTVFDFGTLSSGTTTAATFYPLDILNLSLTGSSTEDADIQSLNTSNGTYVNLTSLGGTINTSNDIGNWINQAGATLSFFGSSNTRILGMTNAATVICNPSPCNLKVVGP